MYSQNDPQWKYKQLGGGPNTIGQDGCFLSSFADLLTWARHPTTPAQLDDQIQFYGEELTDSALQALHPDLFHLEEVYHCESIPCDQNKLNNDDPNIYVIVELSGGSLGNLTHFSPILNWHSVTIADTWVGRERPASVWGAPWQSLIQKALRYRYIGGGAQPAPAPPSPPTPVPAPSAPTFVGIVSAGGAHVRILPGTDQAVVPQPGSNPDIVDAGVNLAFDGWTHHRPKGGADTPVLDNGYNPPRADDRWFRTSPGHHWIASAGINYANGGDPPANLLVTDPAAIPAPPAPIPAPTPVPGPNPAPVPFTGDTGALMSTLVWEWETQANYESLKGQGFRGILIRGANGESGTTDDAQYANWKTRSALARQAGLRAYVWVYWYGPGDAGYTEADPAAYLMRCVQHLLDRQFDTAAFIVDYESRDATGLAPALKALRDRSGKAVFLAPPGDPVEYGINGWPWKDMDAAVDGYAPQFYTGAWNGSISFQHAFGEWTPKPPIFPASDEQDPIKAAQWVQQALVDGITGWSCWRVGTLGDATLAAYAATTPTPAPQPVPAPGPPGPQPPDPVPVPTPTPGPIIPPTPTPDPVPTPPADVLPWLKWIISLLEWLSKYFPPKK